MRVSIGEVLGGVAGLIFGFWVFFPLLALQNVLTGRGNWRAQVRKIPRNLLAFWGIFAFLRLLSFIWSMPIWSPFAPEPLGTQLFLGTGLVVLLLWLWTRRSGGVKPAPPAGRPVSAPAATPSQAADPAPICPKCGVPMVLRTARQGQYQGQQFYGCRNYPNCREIRNL